ncbi:MAG: hypothetical protein LBQ79_04750 [Deltaproteobacteria bacterium]|jgi:hypothetical protein|nr:hypothetical protein [Deltaproteobacteria bacterium]
MKLRPAHCPKAALAALLALPLALVTAGCGVVTDFVHDKEYDIPFLGKFDFVSPAKLRVGILPLEDQIGLGPADAGEHLSRLITEIFSQRSELLMVDAASVADYARGRGFKHPLTQEQAVEICRDLNLNFVMGGAAAHYGQSQVRSGWRKLARWFTDQQQYVEVLLTLRAYDPADGTTVTSRSFESRIHVGDAEPRGAMGEQTVYKPSQEIIEESLDEAIDGVYVRSLDGIMAIPFKAKVIAISGGRAEISFGQDVRMPRGAKFVKLSLLEDIQNDINVTYHVPGAPTVRLTVDEVDSATSYLTIDDGADNLHVGDFIQSWRLD